MAQAAGVSPSQPATQEAPPRTKGSVMATTLVGAHAFGDIASRRPACIMRPIPPLATF